MNNQDFMRYVIFIKSQLLVIFIIIGLLLLLVLYIPNSIGNTFRMRETIKKTKTEIAELNRQKQTINEYTRYNLKDLVAYTQKLVPDDDDTFSIHTTLDALSTQNNFSGVTKNVPFGDVNKGLIPISITTEISLDELQELLNTKTHIYGRFFTIQSFTYDFKNNKAILKLHFFSKKLAGKTDASNLRIINNDTLDTIVKMERDSNTVSPLSEVKLNETDYTKTTLPFGMTKEPEETPKVKK